MNMKYDEEKYRLRTIKHDEKYLRQTSSDVLKGDPDLKQEIEILSNYCRSNGNLMALASVQIGIPKKIIYIMKTDEYDALKEKVGIKGVRAGVVLWLYEKDKVFYIPISTITQMKNDGCKSVGIKALDKYKIYEIPSIKKRTYMTSNYSILLTLQEGE